MDDKDLLSKAQSGDLDAFTEVVKRYQSNVRASLAARLNNQHEAEDLAQEAFIIAYRKLDEFDLDRAFGPWIRSIALNLLHNYWRKHKPSLVGSDADLDILLAEQTSLRYATENESERLDALKICLGKLDEPMGKLLKMRYHEEVPIRDLSKEMNISHSTLTMRLHRIRKQLHQCIQQQMGVFE